MHRVAVIGAGQFGKQHVRSLIQMKDVEVYVVDTNEASLVNIKAELAPENSYFHVLNSVDELPEEIDIAVIATGSAVRLQVYVGLLRQSKVRYVILEKVAFQSAREFYKAMELSDEKGTKVYVNCSKRQYDFILTAKSFVQSARQCVMHVNGSNWGIGCNSIHFADLLYFMTNKVINRYSSFLDVGIRPAKRFGYIEFTGSIVGRSQDGSGKLILSSLGYGSSPLELTISTESHEIYISHKDQIMKVYSADTKEEILSVDAKWESQVNLTNKVVQSLISNGTCPLPTLEECSDLQLPIIDTLLEHYRTFIGNIGAKECPIT